MTRLHKILLFSVIIAGIALRIVFILMNPQPLIHGDDLAYDSMGSNFMKWFLEDKNSLFGTSKPPLYPLFLHVVYSLFGHNVLHAYLSQAILDGFSMAAIFFICYSVFSSFRTAILTVSLYALYPSFIWQTGVLYAETLFTLLLLIAVLSINRAVNTNSKLWYLFTGTFLGLCTLCRPVTFLFSFFLCLCLLFIYRKTAKQIFSRCIILIIGLLIVISPMIIRNSVLAKEFVPVTISKGWYLLYANAPLEYEEFWKDPNPSFKRMDEASQRLYSNDAIDKNSPTQVDNAAFRAAVNLIARHPFRYIALSALRFTKLWFNMGYRHKPSNFAYLIMCGHIVLFLVCLIGIPMADSGWARKGFPVVLLLSYFTLIYTFTHAVYRYIIPVVPYLLLLASFSVNNIYDVIQRKI